MPSESEIQMNSNYKNLLSLFAEYRVRYLVVGGFAVMRYTEPRYTKDLDVWVDAAPENARKVYEALVAFGAPLRGYTPADFSETYSAFQIGVAPVRIDVLTSVAGVSFSRAWENRTSSRIDGTTVHFLSKEDLIKSKRAAGRKQDLIDLDNLTPKEPQPPRKRRQPRK